MRLHCHLREIRGGRPLRELADAAGLNAGTLSMVERGRMLPKDDQLEALEQAYGVTRTAWYDPGALLAIQGDEERA